MVRGNDTYQNTKAVVIQMGSWRNKQDRKTASQMCDHTPHASKDWEWISNFVVFFPTSHIVNR